MGISWSYREELFAKEAKLLDPQFGKFCSHSEVFNVPPPFTLVVGGTFEAPSLVSARLGICGGLDVNDHVKSVDQSKFYIRQDFFDSFQFLAKYQTVGFIGAPGTGKSVCALRYAFYQDNPNAPSRLLLVRAVAGEMYIIWFRLSTGQYEIFRASCYYNTALDFLGQLLTNAVSQYSFLQVDLLIADGFSAKTQVAIHSMMSTQEFARIKLISCCSLQSFRPNQEAMAARPMMIKRLSGWSQIDYLGGLTSLCFPSVSFPELQFNRRPSPTERMNEVIKDRYYYSGGNCRWFCAAGEHYYKHIVSQIVWSIDQCPILDTTVLLPAPEESACAVNSLLVKDANDNLIFSSECIAKHLASKVSNNFILEARNAFAFNPTLQGWISKLQVIKKMTNDHQFHVLDEHDNVIQTWAKSAGTRSFFDHSDPEITARTIGRFYFPDKWNQALFHGIFMVSNHEAHFFNVTDASTHSFTYKYLLPFLTSMGVHRVRFFFICRTHNLPNFHFPATGAARAVMQLAVRHRLYTVRRKKLLAGEIDATDPAYSILFDFVIGKYNEN